MGIIISWKLNKLEAHVFALEELKAVAQREELPKQGACTQKGAKITNNSVESERNSHV